MKIQPTIFMAKKMPKSKIQARYNEALEDILGQTSKDYYNLQLLNKPLKEVNFNKIKHFAEKFFSIG